MARFLRGIRGIFEVDAHEVIIPMLVQLFGFWLRECIPGAASKPLTNEHPFDSEVLSLLISGDRIWVRVSRCKAPEECSITKKTLLLDVSFWLKDQLSV